MAAMGACLAMALLSISSLVNTAPASGLSGMVTTLEATTVTSGSTALGGSSLTSSAITTATVPLTLSHMSSAETISTETSDRASAAPDPTGAPTPDASRSSLPDKQTSSRHIQVFAAEADLQVIDAMPTSTETTPASPVTSSTTDFSKSAPSFSLSSVSDTDLQIVVEDSETVSWRFETSTDSPSDAESTNPATQSPQIVRIVYRVNGAGDFQELKAKDGSDEAENSGHQQPGIAIKDAFFEDNPSQDLAQPQQRTVSFPRLGKSAIMDSLQRWMPAVTRPPPVEPQTFDPYRNWDSDSQERERELEERAREQNHPADDIEDSNTHEVNHFVPVGEVDRANATGRWYLLLLAGNSTTVRLRQKDFAKYLKLNLAARLSVEYNDLKVNRVELKPLLVNVTIFSRPKESEKEEAPLHMLADTNATLLELSGEEYHVLRFITIPPEHQEALAAGFDENRYQYDSYTSSISPDRFRHVDIGVAVYFAIAAALVSILLAVFMAGLWRYLRKLAEEIKWPWRRYKPMVFPKWSLPLQQHRMYADHIASCAPLNVIYSGHFSSSDQQVPVQKILAPEPPKRLMFTAEPGQAHMVPESPVVEERSITMQEVPQVTNFPPVIGQVSEPTPASPAPVAARPHSKLSLFGSQGVQPQDGHGQRVLERSSTRANEKQQAPKRRLQLQPQARHALDVRIHRPSGSQSTVLGLDNPNYLLQ